MDVKVYRARSSQAKAAYGIVKEYYQAAKVEVREDASQFERDYFGDGAGVWLAEDEGHIVGCIALRNLWAMPGCGKIKRLYVQPTYRGRGLADQLLQALEDYAKECGYEWLYLDTAADMKAAAQFYQRKGFQPCERYNENPQAAIFMRKAIR